MEDRFEEIEKFINLMGTHFQPVGVMKVKIDDAFWLVSEVGRLRKELQDKGVARESTVDNREYVDSLEKLLIYMCESYTLVLDKLLELGHTEGNKAYMKVPTIQGSSNRLPIRQLGGLEFQAPEFGFREIYKMISEKHETKIIDRGDEVE